MKRLPVLIVAALAAAATALVLAVGGSAQGPKARTIQLVEQEGQFTEVPNPPKGFSPGDEFVIRGKLTDTSGEAAGTDHAYCVITKASRHHPVADCTASFFLRDGKISVVGGVHLERRKQVLPVVGGTGAYVGAQGTAVSESRKGNKTAWTFNLMP